MLANAATHDVTWEKLPDDLALLNPSMNHAIASSLRAHSARSATEPYFR